jgi:mono/diheme cytochrome c family protein
MLNCRHRTDREKGRRGDGENVVSPYPLVLSPRLLLLLLTAYCLLLTAACRRDMQDQPKAIAYRESTFFKDGVSSRPPVEGTVPRGYLRADREFYFGKKSGAAVGSQQVANAGPSPRNRPQDAGAPGASAPGTAMFPDDVEVFPFPITKEVLERGQERYQIFCSSCHGLTGYGDGMVARRGFNKPAPASFHQDKLRQAPVGHFFDVVTNGWGAMPSHASQIPVEDRWKIIAYIRALQLSQMPPGPGR